MELTNLLPTQKIAVKVGAWRNHTTVEHAHLVVPEDKIAAVTQGIETLDQGLTSTVNLAGIAGYFAGEDVSIDLI